MGSTGEEVEYRLLPPRLYITRTSGHRTKIVTIQNKKEREGGGRRFAFVKQTDALIGDAFAGKLPPRGTDAERIAQFQRFIWFDRAVTASARFEAVVKAALTAD